MIRSAPDPLIHASKDPDTGDECVYIAANEMGTGNFKFIKKADRYEMIYTSDRPNGA